MESISLYLHIPFCVKRCPYCDFNTYAGMDRWIPEYVKALELEIAAVARQSPQKILSKTIFFGGGTPSLLPTDLFDRILSRLRTEFEVKPDAEISLEANPGTIHRAQLEELHGLGFNRLSLGVQSFWPEELALLGRIHSVEEVYQAFQSARQAGFGNINLDLMFGLPGQTIDQWHFSLERALELRPEHLSLYSLTIEEGTRFHQWVQRGVLQDVEDDAAAAHYELAEQMLGDAGYAHYEISNWARVDEGKDPWMCRHNLQYWRGQPYLGFGAGAHGYAGSVRTANVNPIAAYIRKVNEMESNRFPVGPAAETVTETGLRAAMQEHMMVGLRLLVEGVSARDFQIRFGRDLRVEFSSEITKLEKEGLLEWAGERLRLSKHGHLLGNQVFMEFVEG